jgi:hypothetical protein
LTPPAFNAVRFVWATCWTSAIVCAKTFEGMPKTSAQWAVGITRRRADDDRATYREQVFADLDPSELPRLAQAADHWAPLTAEDTYQDGLRALVDGLLVSR